MESEKVKEIKKALECCSGDCTKDCPLFGYNKNNDYKTLCRDVLIKKSLTLINELESENEALQKGVKRLKSRYEEAIKKNADECVKKFCETTMYKEQEKLVNENQQLKDRIAELEKENDKLNERLIVFDPISSFAENYAKGLREAEQIVLDMLMKIVERYRKKLDEQKHFYETAEISHRDISITALNTAYRYLDETLKECINADK